MEPDLNLIRLQQLLKPFENTGITNTTAATNMYSPFMDNQERVNQDIVQQIIAENASKLSPVMYDEFPQGFSFTPQGTTSDASRFAGVDLEPGYLDRAGSYGQDVYSEEPTSLKGKTLQGIEKLLQYLPFGEKSIIGRLIRALPEESPEIRSMKNFYRSQYGLTPTGQVASGIMAGYNPVYGGALNMLTGGAYGKPTQFGLARAARQRIENIAKRRAPQTESSLAKIRELQRFAEADTISRARQAAPDVYARAETNKALGPGGGFSTSGSKRDSGFTSRSSSPSGRGRQDY